MLIPVTYKNNTYQAVIDEENKNLVIQYSWRLDSFGYAVTNHYVNGKRAPNLRMHRLIMGSSCDGKVIDHADRNPLNNCKANLRICTQSENLANKKKQTHAVSSKFKGVYFDKQYNKWRARITYKRKTTHIGLFDTEMAAAEAYNIKAKEVFKEYALLNKP